MERIILKVKVLSGIFLLMLAHYPGVKCSFVKVLNLRNTELVDMHSICSLS